VRPWALLGRRQPRPLRPDPTNPRTPSRAPKGPRGFAGCRRRAMMVGVQLPPSVSSPDADPDSTSGSRAHAHAHADAYADLDPVGAAYADRAAEYAAVLGSMSAVHLDDSALVSRWADGLVGPVLDLGCGPGHWTAFLAGHRPSGRRLAETPLAGHGAAEIGRARSRLDVSGVDPVPAFVEHARRTHPGVRYEVGTAEHLSADDGSLGGVLAWYSLIHHRPDAIGEPLREIARVLQPGGRLLVGFFEAPTLEPFDHAVVTAWRWPVAELAARLDAAGLTVLETTTRSDPGSRPHAAVIAERRTAR
jgi:SAM-dependent methyltransferase